VTDAERPGDITRQSGKESPGLMVIGAGILVGNWVLLGLLAGEWNPGALYIALALMVLLSAFNVGGIALSGGTKRAIGWFMGLAAIVTVLADLRYDGFPSDGMRVVAYILFVTGAVLMLVGARTLPD
jgi:hypothetical protein